MSDNTEEIGTMKRERTGIMTTRPIHQQIEECRTVYAGTPADTDDYLTWKERRSNFDLMLIGALMYELSKALGQAKADAVILDCAQTISRTWDFSKLGASFSKD